MAEETPKPKKTELGTKFKNAYRLITQRLRLS